MKKIAHQRYPLFAGITPPAGRRPADTLEHGELRASAHGMGMPQTVRISRLRQGECCGDPVPLTAEGLRDLLSLTFDLEDATVEFVCHQMEIAGLCELRDETGNAGYLIERILHS